MKYRVRKRTCGPQTEDAAGWTSIAAFMCCVLLVATDDDISENSRNSPTKIGREGTSSISADSSPLSRRDHSNSRKKRYCTSAHGTDAPTDSGIELGQVLTSDGNTVTTTHSTSLPGVENTGSSIGSPSKRPRALSCVMNCFCVIPEESDIESDIDVEREEKDIEDFLESTTTGGYTGKKVDPAIISPYPLAPPFPEFHYSPTASERDIISTNVSDGEDSSTTSDKITTAKFRDKCKREARGMGRVSGRFPSM